MEKLTVEAPSRVYDILVGCDIIDSLGRELLGRRIVERTRPVAVLTSPRIGGHYFEPVRASLENGGVVRVGRYDIPDGEKHKNLEQYGGALNWLSGFADDAGLTPLIITLGGGVVGDLGGFVAHTFRRGVPFVQVTTTLLGAVDCSVGGKVAVNLPAGKNLVGAFHQPSLVMADLNCLRTLPDSEVMSGLSEVIKYGAALDAKLFELLEKNIDSIQKLTMEPLAEVVRRCCRLKADIVGRDELDEKGVRVSLNFGHTVGHAIESVTGYALTHGECVAVGMVAAARLSLRLSLCPAKVVERLEALLIAAGLPVKCAGMQLDVDEVLDVMRRDKKWIAGKNRFVLLTDLGHWKAVEGVAPEPIRQVVEEVCGG